MPHKFFSDYIETQPVHCIMYLCLCLEQQSLILRDPVKEGSLYPIQNGPGQTYLCLCLPGEEEPMVKKKSMSMSRSFQSHFLQTHFCHKKQKMLSGTILGTGEMVHLLSVCSTNTKPQHRNSALAQSCHATVGKAETGRFLELKDQ